MDKRASARRPASPGSQRAAPGTQRRDLRRDELTAAPAPTADPSFPKCYEPNTVYRDGQQAPPPKVLDVLDDELVAQIRRDVLEIGGVLLRGFDVAGPADFERVLLRLGYDLLDDYTPADVRRNAVGGCRFVFTASESPYCHWIGPHHEQSYSRRRPGIIGFYCAQPAAPGCGGETPIFQTRDCLAALDEPTRAQLRVPVKHGRWYEHQDGRGPLRLFERNGARRFFQRRGAQIFDFLSTWLHLPLPNLRHHPPWQQVFHTEDEAEAEARVAARAHDLRWSMEWKSWAPTFRKHMAFASEVPIAVRHPVTGDERMTFAAAAFSHATNISTYREYERRVAHRGALRLWIKLPWREHHSWLTVLKVPFAVRAFVADKVYRLWLGLAHGNWAACKPSWRWGEQQHVDGNPTPFREAPYVGMWEHSKFVAWRRGDVMILDNVNAMHARAACQDPRRLVLTAIGDAYEVAADTAGDAPAARKSKTKSPKRERASKSPRRKR